MLRTLGRLLPFGLMVSGFVLFFLLGLNRYLSFETLARNHVELSQAVANHTARVAALYFVAYIAIAAFSLPTSALMTLVGGYLFGPLLGPVMAVSAAALGSVVTFLAARSALHDFFLARFGALARRLEAGFRRNSFSYLLSLRMLPVAPFAAVNIVAGLLGMRLDHYIMASIIGMLPGAIVFTGVGANLGSLLDAGQAPDASILFRPRILLPLLGLVSLALAPIAYRHFRRSPPPPETPTDGRPKS